MRIPTGSAYNLRAYYKSGSNTCYTNTISLPARGFNNRVTPLVLTLVSDYVSWDDIDVMLQADKTSSHFVHPKGVVEIQHIDPNGGVSQMAWQRDTAIWTSMFANGIIQVQTGIHRFRAKTYLSDNPSIFAYSNEIEINTKWHRRDIELASTRNRSGTEVKSK